jgi:hypothetical protein
MQEMLFIQDILEGLQNRHDDEYVISVTFTFAVVGHSDGVHTEVGRDRYHTLFCSDRLDVTFALHSLDEEKSIHTY